MYVCLCYAGSCCASSPHPNRLNSLSTINQTQVVANVNGKPASMYAWLKWALNDRLRDNLVLWSLRLRKKQ